MQTEVKETGRYERTLTVHIPEDELERAKDAAARKLSKNMKIKGFRPGKAPRAIVERMVGSEALRSEAIEEAIPELVGAAIEESALEPVTVPKVTDVRDAEGGGVDVDVLVTLWPTLDAVPEFAGREVEIEPPTVTDEEIAEQIDALRNQFAELETVDRPAFEGDFVLVNVSTLQGGQELAQGQANDLLYEIGSRSFLPGLDELLVGASAGDVKEGPGELPEGFREEGQDADVTLRVLVKEVRAKKLPELTDEFVADTTEFDTVAELEDTIRTALLARKVAEARAVFSDRVVESLVDETDIELPEALIEAEVEARVRNLLQRLEQEQIPFGLYLNLMNQDQESFLAEVRSQAAAALSSRVLLEGVATVEGIEVTDEDISETVELLAASSGAPADELEEALRQSGQVEALTGDILRRKALDRLVEAATPVDAEGNPVDLTPVVEDTEDEHQDEQAERTTDLEADATVDGVEDAPDADGSNEDTEE